MVAFIQDQFNQLCNDWQVSDHRSVIELKYLIHLIAHFSGELKQGVDWLDCIEALHPTPAVAGTPRNAACDIIAAHEPLIVVGMLAPWAP